MISWFRKLKGTYVRDTPDWYLRQRARAAVQFNAFNLPAWPFTPAVGLVNDGVPSTYIHVIGLTIFFDGDPAVPPPPVFAPNPFGFFTVFAKYGANNIDVMPDPNNAIFGPGTAIYSDGASPPGSTVAGASLDATFTDNTMFNPASFAPSLGETVYGQRAELAVIAPGYTWELYSTNPGPSFFMFDYYWCTE
jgi:hypothetical protein